MIKLYENFSPKQFRNMWLYIAGIVCYKFALETMNTCIFNILARDTQRVASLWVVLQSINYATQCIGSLAVAPLIRRVRTNRVLVVSIVCFGLAISIIPILEVSTGGTITKIGSWTPYILFGVFPVVGLFHGSIELIRRIIPNDIIGGNEDILKKMDSTVHIVYEIAGTSGALLARYWIGYFKYAYALFLLPIFFTFAAIFWLLVDLPPAILDRKGKKELNSESTEGLKKGEEEDVPETSFLIELKDFFSSFFYSVWVGAKLVCSNRSLIWLIPAYTIPLVLHRYLENTLFPFYSKFVLKKPALSQILLAGSNLGELIGASFVLFLSKKVHTPLPWLRLDAFTLSLVWILAYAQPYVDVEQWVWCLFPGMAFLSMGWASGDVSLAAYVQARLSHLENKEKKTSPLGAVMSFLYVSYIVLFPILAYGMGVVMDDFNKLKRPQEAFIYIGGVFMTVVGVLIFLSTFIPKGSFKFNPDPNSDDFDTDIVYNGVVVKRLTEEELQKEKKDNNEKMVELVAGF